MMKKIRLCLFHIEFAYSGGAEKTILKQMDYFQSKAHITCYTSFLNKENAYPEIFKKYQIKQILPCVLNKYIPHEFLILLTSLLFPFLIMRFRNFDFFIGENQPGPFFAFLAAKVFKKPYIAYVNWPPSLVIPRGIDLELGIHSGVKPITRFLLKVCSPLVGFLDRQSIRSAGSVLANGRYVQLKCQGRYNRRIINCPSGAQINKKVMSYQTRLDGSVKINKKIIKKPYVLVTNRHFPKKKLEYGLMALRCLLAKNKNFKLIISGRKTSHTKLLQSMAKDLGVQNSLFFTGYVAESQLPALYDNAYAYLYTAPEEDFGMGIIEAMCFGLPVIAWNLAGPASIIQNKRTGFLAKPGDQKDFCKLLCKVAQFTEAQYSQISSRAVNLAKEKYSWKRHFSIMQKEIDKNID